MTHHRSVSISSQTVHVIWQDDRDGNFEIYYKRNPTGNPVGITNISSEAPGEFMLGQNYPNPFNPVTVIRYKLSEISIVRIEIYDVTGKTMKTLLNRNENPGSYSVEWDASGYPSGVYLYSLFTDEKLRKTMKMVLTK